MNIFTSRRGRLALAFTMLLSSASAMTAVAEYPSAMTSTTLGTEWNCWRLVWLTSCTRVRATESPRTAELGIRADISVTLKDATLTLRDRAVS